MNGWKSCVGAGQVIKGLGDVGCSGFRSFIESVEDFGDFLIGDPGGSVAGHPVAEEERREEGEGVGSGRFGAIGEFGVEAGDEFLREFGVVVSRGEGRAIGRKFGHAEEGFVGSFECGGGDGGGL